MLEPVVQIVHFSDIHLAGQLHLEQRHAAAHLKALLPLRFRQGLARADPAALRAFRAFLQDELTADPAWRGVPVWLVDTGDGTAFGDTGSLEDWMDWTQEFRRAAGPMAQHVQVYGNHDAWPGALPLHEPGMMAEHRDRLRRHWFKKSMPEPALSLSIPGSGGARVEIYTANTVDHRFMPNFLARGVAAPDFWWDPKPPTPGPTPAHDIERMAGTFADNGQGAHFRILAMHYPVARQASPGLYLEQLSNRDAFAEELALRHRVSRPLAHLLLSGHTHMAFPALGAWPAQGAECDHAPLSRGTCQVVCGTLSQRKEPEEQRQAKASAPASYLERLKQTYPFQFNWIRIYAQPAKPLQLLVERQICMRGRGGKFLAAPLAADEATAAQHMQVSLAKAG